MAWITPTNRTTGEFITAAMWNQDVVTNLGMLKQNSNDQGAIQTGRFVAQIIQNELAGGDPKDRPAFHYHDKGSMAMIGRGNAVAAIGKRHFGGFLGWVTWNVVHVMFLIGFGNRLLVMIDWFWNYVRHSRQARLITGDPKIHIKQVRGSVAARPAAKDGPENA